MAAPPGYSLLVASIYTDCMRLHAAKRGHEQQSAKWNQGAL